MRRELIDSDAEFDTLRKLMTRLAESSGRAVSLAEHLSRTTPTRPA